VNRLALAALFASLVLGCRSGQEIIAFIATGLTRATIP
jgi:hypothetical protein